MLHAGVTRLLKGIRAERDQAEKSVVVALVNPGVVGQRRAHAATAAAAMAAIAAEGQVFLMPLLGNGVDLAVIRIVQAGLRGGLDEVERRRGVASLAASTASGSASARRRSRRRGRRCGTHGCSFLGRLGTPHSRSHANNSYQKSNDDLTHCFSSPIDQSSDCRLVF